VLRVAAFPAEQLPDLAASTTLLDLLLAHLRAEMPQRAVQYAQLGRRSPANPTAVAASAAGPEAPRVAPPKPGARVEAELLAEKTKNGGWKARHPPTGLSGPIVNSSEVPGDLQAGAHVQLLVQAVTPRDISFRYPTAATAPPKKGKK
jgi:CRISPR-associated protein Cmr6